MRFKITYVRVSETVNSACDICKVLFVCLKRCHIMGKVELNLL